MSSDDYLNRIMQAQDAAGDPSDSDQYLAMYKLNLALLGLVIVFDVDVQTVPLDFVRWMGDIDRNGKPGFIAPITWAQKHDKNLRSDKR